MLPRLPFLGLMFDPMSANEAALAIAERGRALSRFAYVTTPNADHIVRLQDQPGLRGLYDGAWLNLCDSRILELLAQASYLSLPAAPGSDIVQLLVETHIRGPERVLMIGGTADMAAALRRKYRLTDLRWFDAPAGLRGDADARAQCVDFIRDNPAPFIFLAVGSPQQEMIANEAAARGDCTGVAICCGASLEFLTGRLHRAPRWMQRRRIEWLHRLTLDPRRLWRRYLIDGPRVFAIWHGWRTHGFTSSMPANDVARLPAPGGENGAAQKALPLLGSGDRRDAPPAA